MCIRDRSCVEYVRARRPVSNGDDLLRVCVLAAVLLCVCVLATVWSAYLYILQRRQNTMVVRQHSRDPTFSP